jgi:uncharacterized membrane protein (DUF441 family)
MNGEILLVILILTGLFSKSSIIAIAAASLLILKLCSLERFYPTIERRGLELGILFLTLVILVPFANEEITMSDIYPFFVTFHGWLALLGGALAVYLNRFGLTILRTQPEFLVGLVVGSILGIVLLGGIPVGPLTAAGITAIFMYIYRLFRFR